ncbi:hypothetical protein AAFN85_13725 [Mucilaginibacter sp. CAU 1740]|uniref:hypothetical protein n=1 Tax=Mucilaginibacter sp. CAU 1740 TaxID=3140365 RepID=UPI00325A5DBA
MKTLSLMAVLLLAMISVNAKTNLIAMSLKDGGSGSHAYAASFNGGDGVRTFKGGSVSGGLFEGGAGSSGGFRDGGASSGGGFRGADEGGGVSGGGYQLVSHLKEGGHTGNG